MQHKLFITITINRTKVEKRKLQLGLRIIYAFLRLVNLTLQICQNHFTFYDHESVRGHLNGAYGYHDVQSRDSNIHGDVCLSNCDDVCLTPCSPDTYRDLDIYHCYSFFPCWNNNRCGHVPLMFS